MLPLPSSRSLSASARVPDYQGHRVLPYVYSKLAAHRPIRRHSKLDSSHLTLIKRNKV